jgi:hypothetical protein
VCPIVREPLSPRWLTEPEAARLKPKIAAVACRLRPFWDEPIDDSHDVADCLQGAMCLFPEGFDYDNDIYNEQDLDVDNMGDDLGWQLMLYDELSGLLYQLDPIMLLP